MAAKRPPDYRFPLIKRWTLADDTEAYELDTSGSDFKFQAGQYADLTLLDPPYADAKGNQRTMSIANSPDQTDRLMFAVRLGRSAYKRSLHDMPLNSPVGLSRPTGRLVLPDDARRPVVMIAGGIGITPMRSMIEWATVNRLPHKITLFYSNRTLAATAFWDELNSWAKQNPNFKLVATLVDEIPNDWPHERGMIDAAMIKRHIQNVTEPYYYTAGPPAMVASMREILRNLRVPPEQRKNESFDGY